MSVNSFTLFLSLSLQQCDLVTMARGAFSLSKTELQFYIMLSNICSSTELTMVERDLVTYRIILKCSVNSCNMSFHHLEHNFCKYVAQKQLDSHAGHQEISRCRTRGESEKICCTQAVKHTSKGSTLALKPRVDFPRSPKQGYQRPHKEDWYTSKILISSVLKSLKISNSKPKVWHRSFRRECS